MNKKLLGLLGVLMIVCAVAFAQNTLVYLEQGGAKQVVLSGGEIELRSGATLDVQSGSTLTQAGTITQTGAVNQSSKLDILTGGGEVEISSGAIFEIVSGATWTVADGTIPRADLTEDVLQVYPLPFYNWVDSGVAPLVTPAVSGKFGLGAVGTGVLGLTSIEVDAVGETPTMSTQFVLPPEYVAAGDVRVIITAKVSTGPASVKTVDIVANEVAVSSGTVGADICATSAQSVTTSFAEYSFTITATGLVAGDTLQITLDASITDDAAGATTTMQITGVKVVCDVKG